ncbi:NADPH:quinone oxidoreductase family protein [Saccharopolyspora sp. NPDC049357]|uniref:NADPH:quinone oxidoreductase family protein n=1 Tax=Saccharopolyspora sp. NPDC049357 TaxID=3154507 RepID=UPI00341B4B62
MRAWQVTQLGEPSQVLAATEIPEPEPGPGQIRVSVAAAACNFADVLLCRGEYQVKPDLPFTPGVELCGVVDQVGTGVPSELLHGRVVGQPTLPHGGFAESALLEAHSAFTVPDNLDDVRAAALHLTYLTPWLGLHHRARLQPGEVLVVTGAAGGVGTATIQLGLAAGAQVIGIVSDARKAEAARELGATHVIDRSETDAISAVKELTDGRGADVVFESVGGEAYRQATKYVAFEGRILLVGFASGTIPQQRLDHVFVKNYSLLGLHWAPYLNRHPELVRNAQEELFDLASANQIAPLVRTAHMDELPHALEELGDRRVLGKTVLTYRPASAQH